MLQETSKLRAGGHGFSNSNLAALSQSCGSRPPHHGSRGKVDRKISSSPADHTRVPYSHQNHHYHYQRHTGHPRALQHNPSLHPFEDSRSYHHKQSTVRIKHFNSMNTHTHMSAFSITLSLLLLNRVCPSQCSLINQVHGASKLQMKEVKALHISSFLKPGPVTRPKLLLISPISV